MALIKLSPEQIISYGAEISAMGSQASELLRSIANHVNTMNSVWQGLANTAFAEQYAQLAKQIEPLPEVVQGIGQKAQAGGQAMSELESQISKAMQG